MIVECFSTLTFFYTTKKEALRPSKQREKKGHCLAEKDTNLLALDEWSHEHKTNENKWSSALTLR